MAMKLAAAPKTLSIGRGVTLVTLSLALSQASQAQKVEQIVPSSVGSVGAIGASGKDGVAGGAGLVQSNAIRSATVGALIERLRARTLSPDAAWQSGALNVDDLLYIVEERVDAWGGFNWQKDDGLRRALVGLLARNGGERLKDTSKLSPAVRLWLADYYGNVGDERAVGLAESILGEMKPKVKGQEDLAFQAVERLGWFYRDKGQHEKSVQAWLRLEPLLSEPGWWLPAALLEVAREWTSAGQPEKAQEFYARIAQYGDDWITSVGRLDSARRLMGKGQHNKARLELEQAIKGARTDESRVILLSILSYSYRQTGEWEPAKRFATQALERFEVLPLEQRDGHSKGVDVLARETLAEASGWLKSPIRVEPGELKLEAARPGAQPIVRRLRVRTLKPVTLSATSSTPQVKVRVVSEDGWGTGVSSTEHMLVVECALGVPANATISITSEQYPNVEAKVPVLSGAGS